MKTSIVRYFITIFILSFVNNAFGQEYEATTHQVSVTQWNRNEGGDVRIYLDRSGGTKKNGVIEVNLEPGWKTYWRNPGNSGMAPVFSFNHNLPYEIQYPSPSMYITNDDWAIGYKSRVLLPFQVTVSKDNDPVSGSLLIGICDKICIPVTVTFDFSDDNSDTTTASAEILSLAKESLPVAANQDFKVTGKITNNKLIVAINHPVGFQPNALYLDGGDMQLGPTIVVSANKEHTIYETEILFSPSIKKNISIYYDLASKDNSFSGTLILE